MRKILFAIVVLLAGCDSWDRRYELSQGPQGVYLLDVKSGRVWSKQADGFSGSDIFTPMEIVKDSSFLRGRNTTDREMRKFIRENYKVEPNTWGDFFQGLGK